jgi:GTP diphosphokinase / guanosine-3',5'-bis(diphosphate) 3'-diphosphatase
MDGRKIKENHRSFMGRFVAKIKHIDFIKLDFAYDLAKYGHRNQFRDSGERYFEHVRATAIILVDELKIINMVMLIAALLHDILEDSFLLTFERIKLIFGPKVAKYVVTLTKPKKNDKRFTNDHERHLWYFEQLRNSCLEIKIVKLADRLHNMRTLDSCAPEKRTRKIQETKNVYMPLINDIKNDYPVIAAYFSREMKLAMSKFQ